jgi:RHS repeat-associated protein
MPGRSFSSDSYRYGFNGMEKDDEIKGSGNSYTTLFRQYDPRLTRWLSLDPEMAKYPNQSPYVAFNGNPVFFSDPLGNDPPEVLDAAISYQGTMYEWGGKNPSSNMIGAYDKAIDGTMSFSSDLEGQGLTKNTLSLTSKALKGYYGDKGSTQGVYDAYDVGAGCSFGIDCSGLASKAFNADSDKLMANLPGGRATDQRDQFAELGSGGVLHNDANLVGMGDLLFSKNSKGSVTHVMVATGDVRTNKNGNVTAIQVVHAPQSGGKVETAWKTFRPDRHSIGHTFRKGEQNMNTGNMFQNAVNLGKNMQNFRQNFQTVE